MRYSYTLVAIVASVISCGFPSVLLEKKTEAAEEDSSAGLPEEYAKSYLVAANTVSPDKKFALIYPTLEAEEAAENANHPERIKDYIVMLQPFSILHPLETKWPYFQHQSQGDLSADWSDDSSVALITLDGKWGPRDVFVLQFRNGKLSRITNILKEAHDLLLPNYRKAKADRYNDYFDFIFVEDTTFKLEGTSRVLIDGSVETSPNLTDDVLRSLDRAWRGHVQATWDIPQGKFTSKKVSGELRKKSEEAPD
jgi:hypothetical protein